MVLENDGNVDDFDACSTVTGNADRHPRTLPRCCTLKSLLFSFYCLSVTMSIFSDASGFIITNSTFHIQNTNSQYGWPGEWRRFPC